MKTKIDKNKKTPNFAGIRMTGRFASTSVADMEKAGREAGKILNKLF